MNGLGDGEIAMPLRLSSRAHESIANSPSPSASMPSTPKKSSAGKDRDAEFQTPSKVQSHKRHITLNDGDSHLPPQVAKAKPMPLSISDTSTRLAADARGHVELVKGYGAIRADDRIDSPSLNPSNPKVLEDRIFNLQLVGTLESSQEGIMELKWTRSSDCFVIDSGGHNETVINASTVSTVYYDREIRSFHFVPRGGDLTFRETAIQVDGEQFEGLRGFMEKRFMATKVHKAKPAHFERFKQFHDQTRSVNLQLHSRERDNVSSDVRIVSSENINGVTGVSRHERGSVLPGNWESIGSLRVTLSSDHTVTTPLSTDNKDKKRYDKAGLHLKKPLYLSGQPVCLNDIVVRLLHPRGIQDVSQNPDKPDFYDGPFKIVELPGDTSPNIHDPRGYANEDDKTPEKLPPNLRNTQWHLLPAEQLVKLGLPNSSGAATSWTELSRLRRVYYLNRSDTHRHGARYCYQIAKDMREKGGVQNKVNICDLATCNDADKKVYVCKLASGNYIEIPYVAIEVLKDIGMACGSDEALREPGTGVEIIDQTPRPAEKKRRAGMDLTVDIYKAVEDAQPSPVTPKRKSSIVKNKD